MAYRPTCQHVGFRSRVRVRLGRGVAGVEQRLVELHVRQIIIGTVYRKVGLTGSAGSVARYPAMIPVSSSMMTAVGYDGRSATLSIRFREGGCYRYAQVPRGVFDALLATPSKGAFFHAEIDGRYRYVRED